MQTKISVKQNQHASNWYSFCVILTKDGYTVETEYCQAVNAPDDFKQGNLNAVAHALQLLKLIKEEGLVEDLVRSGGSEPSTSSAAESQEQPVMSPQVQPEAHPQPQPARPTPTKPLRLPTREDFLILEKQRFILDTSQLMEMEVEVDPSRIDDQLNAIQRLADAVLLPVYNTELEFFSKLLDQTYQPATKYSPSLLQQYQSLLDQAESLPDDVMVSDALTLADQMGYELPEEDLGSNPYLFFRRLREEKLHLVVRENLGKHRSVAA